MNSIPGDILCEYLESKKHKKDESADDIMKSLYIEMDYLDALIHGVCLLTSKLPH